MASVAVLPTSSSGSPGTPPPIEGNALAAVLFDVCAQAELLTRALLTMEDGAASDQAETAHWCKRAARRIRTEVHDLAAQLGDCEISPSCPEVDVKLRALLRCESASPQVPE